MFLFSGALFILHGPFYIGDSGAIKYFFSIYFFHCLSTLHLDFKRKMYNVSTCFCRKCFSGYFLTRMRLRLNLSSYEKSDLISAQEHSPHYSISEKFFLSLYFSFSRPFCVCFTLEVEGILFFLMASSLHKK